MSQFARDGARDWRLIQFAREIALPRVPDRDQVGQAAAVLDWVGNNVCYVFDPMGVELVQEPLLTLREGAGDCDDMTCLTASLWGALGIDAALQAVATAAPSAFDHVYGFAGIGDRWYAGDSTVRGATLGWEPPHLAKMIQNVNWD